MLAILHESIIADRRQRQQSLQLSSSLPVFRAEGAFRRVSNWCAVKVNAVNEEVDRLGSILLSPNLIEPETVAIKRQRSGDTIHDEK